MINSSSSFQALIGDKKMRTKKPKKAKVAKVMHEFKAGTLRSGSKKGPKVKSPKQAIAIGMSEARKAGEKGGGMGMPRRKKMPM